MYLFHNDYSEGCHPAVMQRLLETNMEQTAGYGTDRYCSTAADMIRDLCEAPSASVHFLVGGTQTNLTLIDAALRPHQGVLCARTGHIHVHETGAVEATGHKVLALPSEDGKLTAQQVEDAVRAHYESDSAEHTVQPKLVYISNPTELGTIYYSHELEALSRVCRENNLYLFMDGARLGYGLAARDNDLTLPQIARLCDAFYLGGTKVGALFGEALVIGNKEIALDFRYMIKQHGGMLAKGRLLGLQFDALLKDGLYFQIARHANLLADRIRQTLADLGYELLVSGSTNQIFAILPDPLLKKLSESFTFTEECRVDQHHRAVRFCTSWATAPESVELLCLELKRLSNP